MIDPWTYLIISLAVYRVARMITKEQGPYAVFEKFRRKTIRYVVGNKKIIDLDHWIITGVNCPICVSFWLSFVGAALVEPILSWQYVVVSLAISSLTVLISGVIS